MSSLSLHHLSRRFAGQLAVDDVSLEVRDGELLALVGASGSGKTTTLRMAAGYESPDAGQVLLDGRDITALPPERRGFGMVFQHYALFPHMTVEENVAFGLEARGVSRRDRLTRARAALAGVGLEGKSARQVQALSGGEQQRVALARALVIEPPVLLLDEPLSNLDPTLRRTTRDELRLMLHRLGVTALFVTHDQEDAFAVADRVALLRSGRLLQVGTPEELYERPASRDVAEFIGHAALLPAHADGERATITIGGISQRVGVVPPRDGAAPLRGDMLAVLRPEVLSLAEPGDDGVWPGRVTTRRFAGSVSVYHVQLAGDAIVEVASPVHGVREGSHCGVRVSAERVALVPASKGGSPVAATA
jgi:ABC-type Fe3+/spermidine/putrescine transport system ATPase subunit